MALITVEEIKNETGFDLSQLLSLSPQQADKWLARQEREIVNYIGKYAWGGVEQVKWYMKDAIKRSYIKEALMEQVIFLKQNNFVDSKAISKISVAQDTRDISPIAHDILANAGLLYTGKWI